MKFLSPFRWLRRLSWLIGTTITLSFIVIALVSVVWSIGSWYNYRHGNQPVIWGVSWSNKQAENLELDSETGLAQLLNQIPFKRLQLMSYWDEIEPEDDFYQFETLRQQLAVAKSHNLKVSLQLGLHQSHWPKCHQPAWTKNLDSIEFKIELEQYIEKVINQFDSEVNLIEYQLEPEIFEVNSKDCSHTLNGKELQALYEFISDLTDKNITLSRPNNLAIWRKQNPTPDNFGLRLNSQLDNQNWFEQALQKTRPAHYYSFIAGNLKILHSDSYILIRELQAQPDALDEGLTTLELNALETNLSPEALNQQLNYARSTNIATIDLRGAEWWLWKKQRGDDRFWQIVLESVSADF